MKKLTMTYQLMAMTALTFFLAVIYIYKRDNFNQNSNNLKTKKGRANLRAFLKNLEFFQYNMLKTAYFINN